MSLLGVELRRLFARRAVLVLLVGSILASLAVAAVATWQYRPPPDAEVARAEQLLAEELDRPATQRRYDRCLERAGSEREEQQCERQLPQLEWFLGRDVLEPADAFDELSLGLVPLLGFAALLVGATFVGAEFSSGSIGPLLLVRPRRSAVWAAKLGAVTAGVLAAAVVAWALALGVVLAATYRWSPIDPSADLVRDLVTQAGRTALLTAGAGLLGAAITAALRSTLAGLGVVVGYVVLAEGVARVAVGGAVERLLVSNHVYAIALGRSTVEDYDVAACSNFGGGAGCPLVRVFELGTSTVVMAVALAAALAVSVVVFARRDVP